MWIIWLWSSLDWGWITVNYEPEASGAIMAPYKECPVLPPLLVIWWQLFLVTLLLCGLNFPLPSLLSSSRFASTGSTDAFSFQISICANASLSIELKLMRVDFQQRVSQKKSKLIGKKKNFCGDAKAGGLENSATSVPIEPVVSAVICNKRAVR